MRICFLLCFVLIAAACTPTTDTPSEVVAIPIYAVPTIDPVDTYLSNAQINYNINCAHCHGYGGEGQHPATIERTQNLGYHLVPPHDDTGHTWQHPDQVIFEATKYGIQAPTDFYVMTSFSEQLTDEEIFAIIDYIRLWWTDEQVRQQANLTEQFTENNPSWTTSRLDDETP